MVQHLDIGDGATILDTCIQARAYSLEGCTPSPPSPECLTGQDCLANPPDLALFCQRGPGLCQTCALSASRTSPSLMKHCQAGQICLTWKILKLLRRYLREFTWSAGAGLKKTLQLNGLHPPFARLTAASRPRAPALAAWSYQLELQFTVSGSFHHSIGRAEVGERSNRKLSLRSIRSFQYHQPSQDLPIMPSLHVGL